MEVLRNTLLSPQLPSEALAGALGAEEGVRPEKGLSHLLNREKGFFC